MTGAHTPSVAHTPGPFAVHPEKAWIVCTQLDDGGEPCPVAALAWPTKYRSEAETLANGHLFAAAPDLLEALLIVQRNMQRGVTGTEARKGWDKARAAIVKATAARATSKEAQGNG